MGKTKVSLKQILHTVQTIDDYFSEDAGGISFVDFFDKGILVLSISGSCSGCKKNNKYLKYVIKEMINEVVDEKINTIKFVHKKKK